MESLIHYLRVRLQHRAQWLRDNARNDAGYSTETVIITALLVALAIGAIGVITAKVMGKARGINLG